MLAMTPVVLFLIAGLPLALRSASPEHRRVGWIMLLLLATSTVFILALAALLNGSTYRYAVDFTSPILVAALVAWALVWLKAAPGAVRRLVAGAGAALIAYGAVVGVAISFSGYFDGFRQGDFAAYDRLDRATAPLATAAAGVAGHPFITEVFSPLGPPRASVRYGMLGVAGYLQFTVDGAPATIEVLSPRTGPAVLRAGASGSPAARKARQRIVVDPPLGTGGGGLVAAGAVEIPLRLQKGINRLAVHADGLPDPVELRDVRVAER
jgi:hypothetical protein